MRNKWLYGWRGRPAGPRRHLKRTKKTKVLLLGCVSAAGARWLRNKGLYGRRGQKRGVGGSRDGCGCRPAPRMTGMPPYRDSHPLHRGFQFWRRAPPRVFRFRPLLPAFARSPPASPRGPASPARRLPRQCHAIDAAPPPSSRTPRLPLTVRALSSLPRRSTCCAPYGKMLDLPEVYGPVVHSSSAVRCSVSAQKRIAPSMSLVQLRSFEIWSVKNTR